MDNHNISLLGPLSSACVNYLTTRARLTFIEKQNRISGSSYRASILSKIDGNDDALKNVNGYLWRAFKYVLELDDTTDFNNISLRISDNEKWHTLPEKTDNAKSLMMHVKNMRKDMKLLSEQGDGIISFSAILLGLLIHRRWITLIDEPEAFLHSTQIRLLGQLLAEDNNRAGQLLISTHSSELVKGILTANNNNVKILRITKNNSTNEIHILDNKDVNQIWKYDQISIFTNALDGLFSKSIVICEGYKDCIFYKKISDRIDENTNVFQDILFLNTNGADEIAKYIKRYKTLGIIPKVIVDLDVLFPSCKNKFPPVSTIFNELSVLQTSNSTYNNLMNNFTEWHNFIKKDFDGQLLARKGKRLPEYINQEENIRFNGTTLSCNAM